MQPFGKIAGKNLIETLKSEMKSKEQSESDRKVQESLDHFIRQTIGKEPFLSYARPGENPVQWVQWLESLDQQSMNKLSKGPKVEAGLDAKGVQKENVAVDCSSTDLNAMKDSIHSNVKGTGAFGRGLQSPTQRMHSLKIPEAVVAFAQAAAKANGEPDKYLPGWPLLSPKVQMLKCEKCSQEFCSPLNHRRHTRMHRRPLNVEKEDLRKERANLTAFWDKLSLDEARQIVSFRNIMLKEVPGSSIVRALSSFIQQPGLPSLPQFYLKAGAALLDVVQIKSSKFPLPAEELFSVLDDASERTFLCAGTSVSVQRLVFEGEAGKVGLEVKNLVASLGFLVEQRLVRAWIAEKDAEALRCQKELVEEEEAVQKKQAELLERKRLKKLRQKESREKERKAEDPSSAADVAIGGGGNFTELGEGDDSPTALESSTPSTSSSAHDLSNQEQLGDVSSLDVQRSEGVEYKILRLLGEDFVQDRSKLINEYSDEVLHNKDILSDEIGEIQNSEYMGNNDVDLGSRASQVSTAEASSTSTLYFANKQGEQDKSIMECNGRAGMPSDRKIVRGWRERKRYVATDSVSYQKHSHDSEKKIAEANTHSTLKLVRKSYNGFSSGQESQGGTVFSKSLSGERVDKYGDIPLGRRVVTTGNGYKMWTRKTQQTSSSDFSKAVKSETSKYKADVRSVANPGELVQLPLDASLNGQICEGVPAVAQNCSDITNVEMVSSKCDKKTIAPLLMSNGDNDLEYEADQKIPIGEFLIGSMSICLGDFLDGVAQPKSSEGSDMTNSKQSQLLPESQLQAPPEATSVSKLCNEVHSSNYGEICKTGSSCLSDCFKEHFMGSNNDDRANACKPHANSLGGGDSPHNRYSLAGHDKLAKQGSWKNGPSKAGIKVWRLVGDHHEGSGADLLSNFHSIKDVENSGTDMLSSFQDSKDVENSVSISGLEGQSAVGVVAECPMNRDMNSQNVRYSYGNQKWSVSSGKIWPGKEGDNNSGRDLKETGERSSSHRNESQGSNVAAKAQKSYDRIHNNKIETVDQLELKFSLACAAVTTFLSQRWKDAIADTGAIVIPNPDSVVRGTDGVSDQSHTQNLGSNDSGVTSLNVESRLFDSEAVSEAKESCFSIAECRVEDAKLA